MKADTMQIAAPDISRISSEVELLEDLLPLKDAAVLELGCGKAEKTSMVAQRAASVLALEVDTVQLARNQSRSDLPNVRFERGGAESIPADNASFDIVLMFKSLHHVPVDKMDAAFVEIHRVLKPGGIVYISEPVYAGDFNEILRLFHDEQKVREDAFAAEQRAVASGRFSLHTQEFFLQPMHFADFAQFEDQVLKVTHTTHRLSQALYQQVREKFNRHLSADGARFHMPIRADLFVRNP